MKKALIHRYDNKHDILAVEEFKCSDVYVRSVDDDFKLVIVIPTISAETALTVVADAASRQIKPEPQHPWPGRPDGYKVRVKVKNIRFTTVNKVRKALELAGHTWAAQWQVTTVMLDEALLFAPDPLDHLDT